MPALTWSQICARRLSRQALAVPAADPAGAVAAMCGAHAQVAGAGEVSIALRLPDATRADVRAAIWDDRTLVRTYGLRGTVHIVPARDLAMWTGALSAVPRHNAMPDGVRLDDAQVDEIVAAVGAAVATDDRTLDELDAEVGERCGVWAIDPVMPAFQTMWPRWRQAITSAAHRGAVCFGPNRGRSITYASPRRWAPDLTPQPPEPALAALVQAYLHSYGPARPQDFARWLAAPLRWANEVFEQQGERIEELDCGAWTGWVNAGDTELSAPARGLWLLPYFDAHVVGACPRELAFPGRAAERALARTQAGNFPVLLVDGVAAGVWHQRRAGKRLAITVEPLRTLSSRNRRALDDAVERVGMIEQGRPELTIGTITVGPHA